MRVKTSVTLPSALLEAIDRVDQNRSAFLERAAEDYLARTAKAERDARDLAIINKNAKRLNREALDVLEYQDVPEER
jgi:metal-responsive CopG/Arc/MetJ family transcriptional regulator